MELGELEVGDGGTRAPGGDDAIARRDGGIRRMPVEASASAGCEHDRVGTAFDDGAGCLEQPCADGAPALDEEVDEHRALVDVHGAPPYGRDECRLDRGAGRVSARVQDARPRVRGLESPLEARLAAIERDAEADEVAHPGRSLVAEHAHRFRVGEAGTRLDRVGEVPLRAVVGEECRRDAALRVPGVALGELGLRDELDGVPGIRGPNRGPESRDAAADDEDACHVRLPRGLRRTARAAQGPGSTLRQAPPAASPRASARARHAPDRRPCRAR